MEKFYSAHKKKEGNENVSIDNRFHWGGKKMCRGKSLPQVSFAGVWGVVGGGMGGGVEWGVRDAVIGNGTRRQTARFSSSVVS